MMRQTTLVVLVAIVACNSVELMDDAVMPLHESEAGMLGEQADKKIEKVVVPVGAAAARAPTSTVKSLTPKYLQKEEAKWKKVNPGKEPSEADRTEFERLAKTAAAKEINDAAKTETANKKAQEKEKAVEKKIAKAKKTIKRVETAKEYRAEEKTRENMRALSRAKASKARVMVKQVRKDALAEKATAASDSSSDLVTKLKAKLQAAEQLLVKTKKKREDSEDSVIKAGEILEKNKGLVEKLGDEAHMKEHFLKNIEEHEEEARTENKEAQIKVNFELDDAKRVKVLLKKLEAKKDAIDKFTQTLDKKSKRDYAAARSGIAKAKGDYAKAKSNFDKLTKEVAKHESKVTKTKKLIKLATEGVITGLKMSKDAKTIQSAENDEYLQKRKALFQKDVDKEDIKAKGQQKLMQAANAELTKAESLETLARKQKERVKEDRETMAAQVKKIKFFKGQIKQHELSAEESKKAAAAALHRVKTMRDNAVEAKEQAEAKARYIKNIDTPMTKRALEKAKADASSAKFLAKKTADKVEALKKQLAAEMKTDAKNKAKTEMMQAIAKTGAKRVAAAATKQAKAASAVKADDKAADNKAAKAKATVNKGSKKKEDSKKKKEDSKKKEEDSKKPKKNN